jgi:hypothetical protein
MPLNIIEVSLDKVKPEYHELYAKKPDGTFVLDVSDLDKHVEPLKTELDIAHVNERNVRIGEALRRAGVIAEGDDLLTSRIEKRIVLDSKDGARVVRILSADGVTPMAGTGPGGVATLDDLISELTAKFPSMFAKGETPAPNIEGSKPAAKSDFKSEKERAAYVSRHGLAAYNALPTSAPKSAIERKSEFGSEKDRSAWVDKHGLSAYQGLPD